MPEENRWCVCGVCVCVSHVNNMICVISFIRTHTLVHNGFMVCTRAYMLCCAVTVQNTLGGYWNNFSAVAVGVFAFLFLNGSFQSFEVQFEAP